MNLLYRVLSQIQSDFEFNRVTTISRESGWSLFARLPIVSDVADVVYKQDQNSRKSIASLKWVRSPLLNLMHSVVNPFRLVLALLGTVHATLDRLLGFIDTNNNEPNILVMCLKFIFSFVFGLAKMPFTIAEKIVDFGLRIVRAVVVNPIKHILSSVKQLFKKSPAEGPKEDASTRNAASIHAKPDNVLIRDNSGNAFSFDINAHTTVLQLLEQLCTVQRLDDLPENVTLSLDNVKLDRSKKVSECNIGFRSLNVTTVQAADPVETFNGLFEAESTGSQPSQSPKGPGAFSMLHKAMKPSNTESSSRAPSTPRS